MLPLRSRSPSSGGSSPLTDWKPAPELKCSPREGESRQLTWLIFYAIISADEHMRKGERKMSTGQAIKQRVYQRLEGLPYESFEELSHFLDFLKFKYQVQQPRKVVALGGLWKHLDFDVTDAEVRALRQRVTTQLLRKV